MESGDIKLSFCSHGHKFMRRVKFYAVAISLLHTPTHPFPHPLLCIVESIYVHISPNRHMIVIYNCEYILKFLMTVYRTMETSCHRCRLLLLKSRLHVLSMPMCYIYIAAISISGVSVILPKAQGRSVLLLTPALVEMRAMDQRSLTLTSKISWTLATI